MTWAVIGVGNWGKNLARVTCELLGSSNVAVFDQSTDRIRSVVECYPDVQIASSLESILADREIEAVVLATPVSTHAALTKEALLAGKHVFVEKPVALRSREAIELANLADEKQRILMVGHLLLYQPAIAWMANAVGAGLVGNIWSLHQERLHLGTVRTVENALWSLGVHDIAVVLHLAGQRPGRVEAWGQDILQRGIHDDVYVHLEFPSQIQAHLHVSWLWPEKRRQLTVIGSQGILVFDELAQKVTLHRKSIEGDLRVVDNGAQVVFRGTAEPLQLEMEHFLACVREGRKPLTDGRSAADVVAVLEEASRHLGERCSEEE